MLGSSRGSSLMDELDNQYGSSPTYSESPGKTKKERKKEQKKEKAMQDLANLASIPTDTGPQSNEFYNNY